MGLGGNGGLHWAGPEANSLCSRRMRAQISSAYAWALYGSACMDRAHPCEGPKRFHRPQDQGA